MGLPQGGLVSVVIPACNAEATLPQTLASVRAQTYRLLEIIVVDDGSTDRTAEQVRRARADDPRVELISQSNGGVAAARNAGVAASGGEYVAFIDADDLWHPRKIELQVRAAERSVQLPVLVYAWSRRIDKTGRILTDQGRPRHRGHVFCDLIVANFLKNASTALIRREALLAAGEFDQDLRGAGAQGAEDLKLYLAVAERGYVELVPCFLVGYRSSSSSMSRAALNMRCSIEIVLAEVESSRPDLPAALFHMARMNYDLYAANLALAERQWALFARLLARAVRRAPLIAPALVGVAALHRLQAGVGRCVRWPTFDEVALDELAFDLALPDGLENLLAATTRRALRGAGGGRLPHARGA